MAGARQAGIKSGAARAPSLAIDPPLVQSEARRHYGARGIAGLLGPIIRPALKKRAPAAAQLMIDWPVLVGPEWARQTSPQKLVGGTLTLACTGPVAMELHYAAPQLIQRINAALGSIVVERLKFIQSSGPLAPPTESRKRPPAPPAPPGLPAGELGAALAALHAAIMTKF